MKGAQVMICAILRGRGYPALAVDSDLNFEEHRLRNLGGVVTRIEWLLLALALLSLTFAGVDPYERVAILTASMFYAAFVLVARHTRLFNTSSARTVAGETWVMIAFLTWIVWYTDKLASPLVGAYLLVVVASALSLSTRTLLLQLGVIAACYVLLGESFSAEALLSPAYALGLVAQITPLIVIAYMTSTFSAEIRYGIGKAKLGTEKDEITGAYKMSGFAVVADRLFAHASRDGLPLSMLVLRVENLSSIAAQAGADAGSKLLASLAEHVRAELRHNDVLARRGENLFVVLAPETPAAGAADLAERIRMAGPSLWPELSSTGAACRLSIGIASYSGQGRSIDALVATADRALSDAETSGTR